MSIAEQVYEFKDKLKKKKKRNRSITAYSTFTLRKFGSCLKIDSSSSDSSKILLGLQVRNLSICDLILVSSVAES